MYQIYSQDEFVSIIKFKKFIEDFDLFKNDKLKLSNEISIFFKKNTANNNLDFKGFIEILFLFSKKNSKLLYKKDEESKFLCLREFIKKNLVLRYSELSLHYIEFQISNIKIFLDDSKNPYETAIICMFFENNNLLKHVIFIIQKLKI